MSRNCVSVENSELGQNDSSERKETQGVLLWKQFLAELDLNPVLFGHYGSEDSNDYDLLIAFEEEIPERLRNSEKLTTLVWQSRMQETDPTVVAIAERKIVDVLAEPTEFSIPNEDIQNCIYTTVKDGKSLVDYVSPNERDVQKKWKQASAYFNLDISQLEEHQLRLHAKRRTFVGLQYVALLMKEDAGYTKISVTEWAEAHNFPYARDIIYDLNSLQVVDKKRKPIDETSNRWDMSSSSWDNYSTLKVIRKIIETKRLPKIGARIIPRQRGRASYGVVPLHGQGPCEHDPGLDQSCLICGTHVHQNSYPLNLHEKSVWQETQILCEKHAPLVENDPRFQKILKTIENTGKYFSETDRGNEPMTSPLDNMSITIERASGGIDVTVSWNYTASYYPAYTQRKTFTIPCLLVESDTHEN